MGLSCKDCGAPADGTQTVIREDHFSGGMREGSRLKGTGEERQRVPTGDRNYLDAHQKRPATRRAPLVQESDRICFCCRAQALPERRDGSNGVAGRIKDDCICRKLVRCAALFSEVGRSTLGNRWSESNQQETSEPKKSEACDSACDLTRAT